MEEMKPTPRPHTTHFDDCGCKSDHVKILVEALENISRHQSLVGGQLAEISVTKKIADDALSQWRKVQEKERPVYEGIK